MKTQLVTEWGSSTIWSSLEARVQAARCNTLLLSDERRGNSRTKKWEITHTHTNSSRGNCKTVFAAFLWKSWSSYLKVAIVHSIYAAHIMHLGGLNLYKFNYGHRNLRADPCFPGCKMGFTTEETEVLSCLIVANLGCANKTWEDSCKASD